MSFFAQKSGVGKPNKEVKDIRAGFLQFLAVSNGFWCMGETCPEKRHMHMHADTHHFTTTVG